MGSQPTTAPAPSLPAGSTATTTASGVLDNGCTKQQHSAFITIAGTLTAGVVTLETSLDNVNWSSVPANGGAVATAAGFSTGTGVYVLTH